MIRGVLQDAMIVFSLLLFCCQSSGAQTSTQPLNESLHDHKVEVESLVISGTQGIDSAELAEITDSMSGSTFNDDADELGERIRGQFQDRGYFKAEIQKLDIKVLDPIASPKPVRLEAKVSEGPRFRLSNIEFTGNHALSTPELRGKFPIKTGDKFARSKIATGLESMSKLYTSFGFLDVDSIPETKVDSAAVSLHIEIEEGQQYRMGTLEILGPSEVAEKLQVRWDLPPGAVFNATYVETFVEMNHSLLPSDFTQANDVSVFPDCRDGTVSVHLHLTSDPQHAALDRTKQVECKKDTGRERH
jgi:outer membrane translocation and assembly module TamA